MTLLVLVHSENGALIGVNGEPDIVGNKWGIWWKPMEVLFGAQYLKSAPLEFDPANLPKYKCKLISADSGHVFEGCYLNESKLCFDHYQKRPLQQAEHAQPGLAPLLVRDQAAALGITCLELIHALKQEGFGNYSVNTALTTAAANRMWELFEKT